MLIGFCILEFQYFNYSSKGDAILRIACLAGIALFLQNLSEGGTPGARTC
jgi:hypothetical protein